MDIAAVLIYEEAWLCTREVLEPKLSSRIFEATNYWCRCFPFYPFLLLAPCNTRFDVYGIPPCVATRRVVRNTQTYRGDNLNQRGDPTQGCLQEV